MKNELRVFTVQEANQLLPEISVLLQKIRAVRNQILNLEVEIDALEIISEKKDTKSGEFSKKVEEYSVCVNSFYALIDELHKTGCILKDPEMGLVDFHSLYQGRIVFLCWHLGEGEISHWHEVGGGYATRQPLESKRP